MTLPNRRTLRTCLERVEDAAPTVAVLHVGRGDQHDDQQAEGVHEDVALAAIISHRARVPPRTDRATQTSVGGWAGSLQRQAPVAAG
jgi:hypothetical protein